MSSLNIIDIESSGLHIDAYPIEIGVQLDDFRRTWLIKPEPKWQYWCDTAESMHGISRKQLLREGLPAARVAQELSRLVVGSSGPLYSDAVYWDEDWLDTLYYSLGLIRPYQISSIFDLMDNEQEQSFKATKDRLSWTGQYQNHRAADDLRLLMDAYRLTMNQDSFNPG